MAHAIDQGRAAFAARQWRTAYAHLSDADAQAPFGSVRVKSEELVGLRLHQIARRGISILLVEQKLTIALKISHRVFVMGHGHIVFEGTPDDLRANEQVRREWLEV